MKLHRVEITRSAKVYFFLEIDNFWENNLQKKLDI